MPIDWMPLSEEERAKYVLDNIEGIDDIEVQELFDEWKGSEDSLNELTRNALDRIARKSGTPTSKERARASLVRRGVLE